jgi:hypothetical protein
MVSVVIYGIIAIALAAAAGYALLVFSSTTQQTTQVQENSIRLDQAVNALRASLLALDNTGTLFAPYGSTSGAYMQLPASLGAVSSSPWGTPFEYCPVSLISSTGLTTTPQTVTGVSSSYTANVSQGPLTNNNYYVITTSSTPPNLSTAANYGYVAFIVSSLTAGQPVPDCSAISISSTGVSVTGGSVRGVTAGFTFTQRVIASTDRMEIYVGTGGASYTGTGDNTGRDIHNLTTLPNALAMYEALQPRLTEIYLTGGGTYSLIQDINAQYTGTGPGTRSFAPSEAPALIIAGANGPGVPGSTGPQQATLNITATLNLTTPVTFAYLNITDTVPTASVGATYMIDSTDGAPLTFYEVNFTGPATSPYDYIATEGTTQFIATSLSYVKYNNIGGTTIISPTVNGSQTYSNTSFYIDNGRFYIYGNNSTLSFSMNAANQYNFIFNNSQAEIDANSLTVNNGANWAFDTQYGSTLFINGASMTITDASGAAGAFVTQFGSNLNFYNFAATINNSSSSPAVDVLDNSTMSLTSSSMSISNTGGSSAGVYALAGQIVSSGSTISVANSTPHGVYLDSGSSFDGFGSGAITATGTTLYPLSVSFGSSVNMNNYTINTSNGSTCMLIYNDNNGEYMTITKNTNANSGQTPGNLAYIPYYYTGTAAGTQQSKDFASSYGNYYNGTGFTSTSPTAIALTPPSPVITPTSVDPTTFVEELNFINSHSYFNKRLTFNTFTCN